MARRARRGTDSPSRAGRNDARVLRLVVRAVDDQADAGLREVLRARKGRRHRAVPVTLSMRAASELLTWPRLALLRQIREGRPRSLLELGEVSNRTPASVQRDLHIFGQLGLVASGDSRPGKEVPTVRYDRIQVIVEL